MIERFASIPWSIHFLKHPGLEENIPMPGKTIIMDALQCVFPVHRAKMWIRFLFSVKKKNPVREKKGGRELWISTLSACFTRERDREL